MAPLQAVVTMAYLFSKESLMQKLKDSCPHRNPIPGKEFLNVMTKEKSQALGLEVLKNLALTPNYMEKLDTLAYRDLVKAGNDALLKISGPRKPGSSTMFGFAPSADGVVLIQQPFSHGFANISNEIPLMMGSTLNELMITVYAEKDLTMEEAKEHLVKESGEKTNQYIKLFAKAYPDYTPQDLLSVDTVFRPNTIRTADVRALQGSAQLYVYFLAWKSLVNSATKGSFHGLDIPLVFNNVDLRPDWTGNSEEAWGLADLMSSAWLNFAKTGNPNVDGKLPEWKSYTKENGATMYFDKKCRIVNNHDREFMQFFKPVH
jgi:para-nitrobenzyl esterase